MERFQYTISDVQGLHARNAVSLCKIAEKYTSSMIASVGERKADCKNVMSMMNLRAAQNEIIFFSAEGEDEKAAIEYLKGMVRTLL